MTPRVEPCSPLIAPICFYADYLGSSLAPHHLDPNPGLFVPGSVFRIRINFFRIRIRIQRLRLSQVMEGTIYYRVFQKSMTLFNFWSSFIWYVPLSYIDPFLLNFFASCKGFSDIPLMVLSVPFWEGI